MPSELRSVALCVVAGTLALISCGKSGSQSDKPAHGQGATSGAAATQAGAGGQGVPLAGSTAAGGAPGSAGTMANAGSPGTAGSGAESRGGSAGRSAGISGTPATTGGSAGSPEAGAGSGGEGGGGGDNDVGPKPLTVFFMVDRSWLMNDCGDEGTATQTPGPDGTIECPTLSRWAIASSVLSDVFRTPNTAGISFALRFFPDDRPHPGCSGYNNTPEALDAGALPYDGPNCMADVCAEPFVPAAPLTSELAPQDVQEGALLAALDASAPPGPKMPNPNPNAPTSAAVEGAEQWARAFRDAHPNERAAVVLVTSGLPNGCDTNLNHFAPFVADAYTKAGVRTYALGFSAGGQSTLTIDHIAIAGGTQQAFIATDDDVRATLVEALKDFQRGGQ